ncbi:TPA: hypothetical protein ACVNRJ_004176 [Escherichia coli]
MDKNTTAYWNLSLDTECPKCGHNFDLLCDAERRIMLKAEFLLISN